MILLDSNVLNALVNGLYIPRDEYRISAVTMGECLRGAMIHPQNDTLRRISAVIDETDDDTFLPYGPTEARMFARIARRVTARKRIPDLMIAATALVADLPLVTYDAGLDAIAREIAVAEIVERPLVVRLLEN